MQKNNKCFSRELLGWYQQHARDLPWRNSQDPYIVWISEVMLQQTRVDTVIPFFEKWIMRFPDLLSLAAAEENEFFGVWEGLGYYARVRNIVKTARILLEKFNGKFPDSANELRKFPGIGEYIAAAITSFAFGRDEVALDANALRVFSRLFEFSYSTSEVKQRESLKNRARELMPIGRALDFNQAIMDLGSLICMPRQPACIHCPLQSSCLSFQHGTQSCFPIKKPKKSLPHYEVVAAVIKKGKRVLIDKRRAQGLLGGLWEFPGGKVEAGEDFASALMREIKEELGVTLHVLNALGVYKHAYTHFRVTVHVFMGRITAGEPSAIQSDEILWVKIEDLQQYPMGKVDRLIAQSLKE